MACFNVYSSRFALAAFAAAGLALASSDSAMSRDGDAFADLAGTWSGSGRVVDNGKPESLRCRATYAVSPDRTGLNQTIVCASSSYKLDVFANVVDRGGHISGQWTERSRGINGTVSGTAHGNRIDTEVDAGGFQAALSVSTSGNRQNVVIHPRNYEVTEVAINLTRSR